jgi:hypothetical protein
VGLGTALARTLSCSLAGSRTRRISSSTSPEPPTRTSNLSPKPVPRMASPGGVGAGLYGMLSFALLAVFIAGLMVGRRSTWAASSLDALSSARASARRRTRSAARRVVHFRLPILVLYGAPDVTDCAESRRARFCRFGQLSVVPELHAAVTPAACASSAAGGGPQALTGRRDAPLADRLHAWAASFTTRRA